MRERHIIRMTLFNQDTEVNIMIEKYNKPVIDFYEFNVNGRIMLTISTDNLDENSKVEDEYEWGELFG